MRSMIPSKSSSLNSFLRVWAVGVQALTILPGNSGSLVWTGFSQAFIMRQNLGAIPMT